MSKHTPGPWEVGGQDSYGTFCIVNKPGGGRLAEVPCPYNFEGKRTPESAKVMEANARLIAAAPEMLAALEEMVFFCNQTGSGPSGIRYSMEAAIKKARGEE